MKKTVALFSILILVLGFAFAQSKGETLRVVMDPGEDSIILNPYTASDSNSIIIMMNLYDGLFSYDGDSGEPQPALAESYSVSDDGLTWTFTLKKAKFSDGTEITAQIFCDSWNYLAKGPLASNLSFVSRNADGSLALKAVDKKTLVVKLDNAVSYLPSLLCQPCLAAIKDTSSYSGAYKLVKQDENIISLRRNAFYWDNIGIDFVDILLGDNYGQAFRNGEIQWSMAHVEDASDWMVVSRLYATTFFYFSAKDGAYANEAIRKALISVVPWPIIRYIQGTLIESQSIVPDSGLVAQLDDDTMALLQEGGYPYGQKALPVLNMAVTRGSQNSTAAELIAEIWSKYLGMTVTLNTVPLTVYASQPENNPYDFCSMTWIGDYYDPMAFLSLFQTGSFNLANYSNPQFDDLLEKARVTNGEEREELLKQAEQLLLDSGVVIPMSTALATNFVHKELISGWYTNPMDLHPFKELSFIH